MLINYFKIAWRNLTRNKLFSVINIAGLTIAMTFAMMIGIWVQHEISVDQFHSQNNRIYKVKAINKSPNGDLSTTKNVVGPLAEALMNDVPEIQSATRYFNYRQGLVTKDDKKFYEGITYTDSSFFTTFDFHLLFGDRTSLFRSPNEAVITKDFAEKYFGQFDVMGKHIHVHEGVLNQDFTISGVIENPPTNSSLQYNLILPFATIQSKQNWMNSWGTAFLETYVLLKPNSSKQLVDKKIMNIPGKYHGWDYHIFLHPFQDIHLNANVDVAAIEDGYSFSYGGLIRYVRIFGLVALAILLLGAINFMNLSTAIAGKRAKEIGLRKMTGARRSGIIFQFLGEATLVSTISVMLALLLTMIFLPYFNSILGISLIIPFEKVEFWVMIILSSLLFGMLAGCYPAFFLSSFSPGQTIKQFIHSRLGNFHFRRGLVIFQMAISVLLIICTLIVLFQIQYINNKDLGVSRDNLIYFEIKEGIYENLSSFEQEMNSNPHVKSFTYVSDNPLQVWPSTGDPKWEGADPEEWLDFHLLHSAWDVVETMGMTLKEGRTFSRDFRMDSSAVILNEEAVRKMGMENPVGKWITFWGRKFWIIGVVKDFHYLPLQYQIDPMIIDFWPQNTSFVMARIDGNATTQAIESIQATYDSVEKEFPFEYHFVDQDYEAMYRNEKMLGSLTRIFAVLAIFISCLGLYGLVAYTTRAKNKEISIRKVNGANIISVLRLLITSYIQWILLANILAWPIAWYMMNGWLSDFAYRIEISWWIFGLGGLTILGITLATVGYQTLKASMVNPARILRSE